MAFSEYNIWKNGKSQDYKNSIATSKRVGPISLILENYNMYLFSLGVCFNLGAAIWIFFSLYFNKTPRKKMSQWKNLIYNELKTFTTSRLYFLTLWSKTNSIINLVKSQEFQIFSRKSWRLSSQIGPIIHTLENNNMYLLSNTFFS